MTTTGRLKMFEPKSLEMERVLSAIERDHKKGMREIALVLQLDYAKVERRIMEATNG